MTPANTHTLQTGPDSSRGFPLGYSLELLLSCIIVLTLLGVFFAPASALDTPSVIFRAINWLSSSAISVLLLVIFAKLGVLRRRCLTSNPKFNLVIIISAVGLLSIPIGFINQARQPRLMAYDCIPYIAAVFALLGGAIADIKDRILRILTWELFFASIFAVWVIKTLPVSVRTDFTTPHYLAYCLLMPSAYFLPNALKGSITRQGIGILSVAIMLLLNVIGQNRLAILMFGIYVPILSLYLQKSFIYKRAHKAFISALIFISIAVISIPFLPQTEILAAWNNSLTRFFGGAQPYDTDITGLFNNLGTEYDSTRGGEAKDFIAGSDLQTWLIGKGAGGTWNAPVWGEENWGMVHFGPLNLVLRGGIGLAIVFLYLLAHALKRAWRLRKTASTSGEFIYLSAWAISFLLHGPLPMNFATYFFWIIIGLTLSASQTKTPSAHHNARSTD